MIEFDCGKLCAPDNEGIPVCCENDYCVPVLYHEEFKWRRTDDKFWKRMPPKTKEIKKFIDESESYYVFSQCPGPASCVRSKRSFNCMTFPFEPHIDKKGEITGLSFGNNTDVECPLPNKPNKAFNRNYISNALTFWQELFELYPEEHETYMKESRKRERIAKKTGKHVRLLTG